jgi:hypothetical protein
MIVFLFKFSPVVWIVSFTLPIPIVFTFYSKFPNRTVASIPGIPLTLELKVAGF